MPKPIITLGMAVDEFLTVRSDLSDGSRTEYGGALKHLVRSVGKDKNMRLLSPADLEAHFLTGTLPRIRMVMESTFNKERAIISTFLNFCEGRRWCDPYLLLNVRRLRVPERRKLRLSPNELLGMLEWQKHPRDRIAVAMAMNTALRSSELQTLRLADVDLDGGWLYVTIHKTAKVDTFPINADLDAELRRWLTWYAGNVGPLRPEFILLPPLEVPTIKVPEGGGRARPDTDRVLGVRPLASSRHSMLRPIKAWLSANGYDPSRQGVHTIRRSVARAYYDKLVDEGVDDALRVTQQLLNHSGSATTELYIGVERERTRRDESLRGKPFLSTLTSRENVTPLRRAE